MKINTGVMSALLSIAMLAMPLTASARTHYARTYYEGPYRGAVRPYQAYRQAPNFRVPPPLAMTNRFYAPPAAFVPMRPRYYAPLPAAYAAPAPSCAMPAPYSAYAQPYNYMPAAYGDGYAAPMGGGVANMIRQRNSGEYLYRLALQRGNHDRAHHLGNDISQLNKNIANARMRSGIGPAYGNFNPPIASNYGGGYGYNNSPYGYGSNSGLSTMVAPLLGGFIH